MDNKLSELSELSELSKPVAWDFPGSKEESRQLGYDFELDDEQKANCSALYSQEYVSALLEKSKEKDERAIACVNAFDGIETERIAGKSLGEFLAGELYLNKAEPKQDGSFGFTFSGLAVQLMADCFADQFKSSGAINYLELLFEHAEVGEMTVTMQRVEGLTPAQKLAAAEQRIAELEAQVKVWESAATKHLERAEDAEKRLATPVRLQSPWVDKVGNRWLLEGTTTDVIRAAGFKVEGDEQ